MKKTLLSTAICLSFAVAPITASAVNLEVAFQYPSTIADVEGNEMSRYVVGFYRQLETANAIYKNNGVDITLVPAYIQPLTYTYDGVNGIKGDGSEGDESDAGGIVGDYGATGDYTESTDFAEALYIVGNYYDQGANITPQADVHVALGLAHTFNSDGLGQANAYNQADYDNGSPLAPAVRMSLGMFEGNFLSPTNNDQNDMILAHELAHTVGLEHFSYTNQVLNWNESYQIGYSAVCDNGDNSMMHEYISDIPYNKVQVSGVATCNSDDDAPNADSVTFLNHYAPLMGDFVNDSNIATLSLDVAENTELETFTFTVTRTKNIANADTGKLYIAGGSSDDQENENIAPITLTFEAGSETSLPVDVDFSKIHDMFEIANDSSASTYAVAVLDDEVMPKNIDLLTKNTAWEAPKDEPTGGTTPSTSGGSGGGGGGSSSFAFLMLMFTALVLRKKTS